MFAFIPIFIRLSHKDLKHSIEQDFAQTAIHLGNHPLRVAFKHGLPILIPKLKAQMLALISVSIGIESSLSYLGIGPPLPHTSLGTLIYDSFKYWNLTFWYPLTSIISFLMLIYGFAILSRAKPQLSKAGPQTSKEV